MKRIVLCTSLILILSLLISCAKKEKKPSVTGDSPDVYLQFSATTDPGEYDRLLDELPTDLKELCALIKKQLIHPVDAGKFRDVLPRGRDYEDREFPTVRDMLKELVRRDPAGLTADRRPENRLVVACYHHAMLLAAILRYQDVPARIRTGFARYYEKQTGIRFGHAICQVWDETRKCWILVDPDRQKVNVPISQFESGPEAWLRLRDNAIDPENYTSSAGNGHQAILHIFLQDVSCVLLEEKPYWKEPPLARRTIHHIDDIEPDQLKTLDEISGLMLDPEVPLTELSGIFRKHTYLQLQEQTE